MRCVHGMAADGNAHSCSRQLCSDRWPHPNVHVLHVLHVCVTQVNGVPSCADASLLNGMLRQKWGFDGFVVSDCGAVEAAAWGHNYRK